MKNPIDIFFGWLARKLEVQQGVKQEQTLPTAKKEPEEEITTTEPKKQKIGKEVGREKETTTNISRRKKPRDGDIVTVDPRDIRDIMELMEVPFLSLSKNRIAPIIYESPNGKSKIKISAHRDHYLASIYDWDIIIFVSSKLQETINSASDIPPRTLIVSRNELVRSIYRHSGKTTDKEIEAALNRLRSTLIETTIHNEDFRYKGGFGFLDSWGYTERKDIKEFRITLSQWLYEITCQKGALLKVHPEYFKITSGLKRFLYRTARKHVGNHNESWTFSIETLYEKSGSEREFKKFKHDLKKAVNDSDIPGYLIDFLEKDGKELIKFTNVRKEFKKILEEQNTQPSLPFL